MNPDDVSRGWPGAGKQWVKIAHHLGDHAPAPEAEVAPFLSEDGKTYNFLVENGATYRLGNGYAIRFVGTPDGPEEAIYYRDGKIERHIFNPPPGQSN